MSATSPAPLRFEAAGQPAGGDTSSRARVPLWPFVALAVAGGAVAWVVLTRMRPSYDAFGWLVWGRQLLHWNLNTDGAPSWKPLTFLFTGPYALAGANVQMWLWMFTSSLGALAGAVFAARIAFRLAGPCPRRRWAPFAGAAFAGVAVLGIIGYSQLILIASSDPVVATLCLAAIDAHLSGRRRLAFALLILASFGRPETWAFAALYAGWTWRTAPSAWSRVMAACGIAAIPLAWFVVPALTSHSWLISGDLALNSKNVIHGNKFLGVLGRERDLYELPMQLWVAFAIGLAIARRERAWLTLIGAAALWVVIEIAFAYHGWSAVPRYLIEPAAVLVALAGAAVGWVLAYEPVKRGPLRWAGVIPVAALLVALVPAVRNRVQVTGALITKAHAAATELARLQSVIDRDGGPARIRACGQPVTLVGKQSEVAWATDMNVGNVGYKPGREIDAGLPIVVLKPHEDGWEVQPYHTSAGCRSLKLDSQFG